MFHIYGKLFPKNQQSGFVTMIVMLILMIALVMFLVYKRVLSAQS